MVNQQFYTYQCPCCGASMEVSPDLKRLSCEYCGKKLTLFQNKATGQTELRKSNVQNARSLVPLIIVFIFLILIGSCVSCFTLIGGTAVDSQRSVSQIKQVDPFEKMANNSSVTGYAPYGKFNADKLSNSEIRGIKYTVDKATDLKNGDIVTITAEPLDGYTWTKSTTTITVEGLDTVITDESQISEADLNVLHDYCIKKAESDIRGTLGEEDFDSSDISLTIEPYNIYCLVSNDHNFYSVEPFTIFAAYEVDYEILGASGTFYKYVRIPQAVIDADGSLKASYDKSSTTDGFLWVEDLGVKDHINYVDGYLTILEMESSMEQEGCKLYK